MRRWHETASRLRSFDAAPARKLVVYEVRARVQCPTALTLDKCRPFVGLTGVYMYTCHCTVMHFCTRGKTSVHIHCRTCCVRARTLARTHTPTHAHTHTHTHTHTHAHTHAHKRTRTQRRGYTHQGARKHGRNVMGDTVAVLVVGVLSVSTPSFFAPPWPRSNFLWSKHSCFWDGD